jgi:hypothetical protein
MLSFDWSLYRIILRITAYDAVCKATTQPSHIEPLVKQLTDLRKTSLAMVGVSVLCHLCMSLNAIYHPSYSPFWGQ